MQKKIIGRKEELQELDDIYTSKKAEFVAVYGRRRVGKSYLINNYFSNKKAVFFSALGLQKGSLSEQLEYFTEAIANTFYEGLKIQIATRWKDAFQLLTTAIEKQSKNQRIVLFLDELPWMNTPRSGLLMALEYFWNKYWCHYDNLKLIICGSSASWILKKIIYNKGGLHNRITKQLCIKPFVLAEVKSYLEYLGCHYNHQQVSEIYMALGGIPFYLDGVKKRLSASQNINNLYFRKGGLLFDEFDKLFSSLYQGAEAYVELIKIISKKHYGISRSDIENSVTLTQKGGSLTDRLRDLEAAGFILSFLPMGYKKRNTYYKVIDEFSLFYLTWVSSEKTSLLKMERNSNFWKVKYGMPEWHSWSGYAFEAVCYKHIDEIRNALDVPDGSKAITWRYQAQKGSNEPGAQIDLLFDRNDQSITVCEIKYTQQPFKINKAYAKNLLNKIMVFESVTKTNKQIFMTMISANGIRESIYSEDFIVGVVTLDDLFR